MVDKAKIGGAAGSKQVRLPRDVLAAADAAAVKETKRTGRGVTARDEIERVLRAHYGIPVGAGR